MTSPLDQKIRIDGPVAITANRLQDGAVIYRSCDGGWTTNLDLALITASADEVMALLKEAAGGGTLVVGAYAAPVDVANGRVSPGNLRERIRCSGPTFDLPRVPADV